MMTGCGLVRSRCHILMVIPPVSLTRRRLLTVLAGLAAAAGVSVCLDVPHENL